MEICKFPKLGSNIQSQVSTSLVSENWNKTPNNIREKESVARFRTGSREYLVNLPLDSRTLVEQQCLLLLLIVFHLF